MYSRSAPYDHAGPGAWSGKRVRASRSRRSVIAGSGICSVVAVTWSGIALLPGWIRASSWDEGQGGASRKISPEPARRDEGAGPRADPATRRRVSDAAAAQDWRGTHRHFADRG